jgi:hypothetical protein
VREPTHASLLWLEHFLGERYGPMVFLTELYEMLIKIRLSDRLLLNNIAGLTQTSTRATVRMVRTDCALTGQLRDQ